MSNRATSGDGPDTEVAQLRAALEAQRIRHADEIRKQTTLIEESLSALNQRALAHELLEAEADTLRRMLRQKEEEVALLTVTLAQSERALRAREADQHRQNARSSSAMSGALLARAKAPLRWLRRMLAGRR